METTRGRVVVGAARSGDRAAAGESEREVMGSAEPALGSRRGETRTGIEKFELGLMPRTTYDVDEDFFTGFE